MNTVVFDMGGVLPSTYIGEYIADFTDDLDERKFIKDYITGSVEWIMSDRGVITDEEFIELVCQKSDSKYHELTEKFISTFRTKDDPNPKMYELVQKLKSAGIKVYVFSNVGFRYKQFFPHLSPSPMYDFDGLWASCEYKVIKPETEAFNSFFEKFDLKPEDCFFIDDSPANIEKSIQMGMQGFVYKGNVHKLEQTLKQAGFVF